MFYKIAHARYRACYHGARMATDIPDRVRERIPNHIGPYEIRGPIGEGGMGLALLAMRTDLGKPCVVKLMHAELASNPTYCEMFRNEAFVGAQLQHNRIVGVQDFGEHEGRLFLVMDRVDGVNLDQFLKALALHKAGPLELGLVLYIIEEVLEALAYAHDRLLARVIDISVIHRDITPRNIMISSRGEVLLTDFGIARWVDESGRTSKPIGTLLYMAPEQLLGQVTRQSDLYSLGVIFHELLTGSPPLASVPKNCRPEALVLDPIPPTGRDDVPPELEELRLALLQKRPEKRLRTAAEGLDMLKRYCGERARSIHLRDLYLRLIGPPSSGWTGYLKCAESRGAVVTLHGPWLERLHKAHLKLIRDSADSSVDVVSDRLYWANDPELADDEGEDQSHTRPWAASPPSRDANAANIPLRTEVLQPGAGARAKEDETQGRCSRRVRIRRASDNGTGPDGRVDAPRHHREAVLQPAAVALPPAPTPVTPREGGS
jgi:serine/threonine protein kinase